MQTVPMMGCGIRRTELQGTTVFLLCATPVPVTLDLYRAECGMCGTQAAVQIQCTFSCVLRFPEIIVSLGIVGAAQQDICLCECGIGLRIIGICTNGVGVVLDGSRNGGQGSLIPEISSAKVGITGLRVHCSQLRP